MASKGGWSLDFKLGHQRKKPRPGSSPDGAWQGLVEVSSNVGRSAESAKRNRTTRFRVECGQSLHHRNDCGTIWQWCSPSGTPQLRACLFQGFAELPLCPGAQMGMLRAIHRRRKQVFNPRGTHRGKRKQIERPMTSVTRLKEMDVIRRAYQLWQQAREPSGRDEEFYYQAKQELQEALEKESSAEHE